MIKKAETESGKKVLEALRAHGHVANESDTIAYCYDTDARSTKVGYISFNYRSTDIKFNVGDLDEAELALDGIKLWRTWNWTK